MVPEVQDNENTADLDQRCYNKDFCQVAEGSYELQSLVIEQSAQCI